MKEEKFEQRKRMDILPYVFGLISSAVLTLCAYFLVELHLTSQHQSLPHQILIPLIIGIAILQLICQMAFFLHMVSEKNPRWNLIFFLSTVSIVFIMVVGGIWIMNHLNYNMMPDVQSKYLIHDEGIQIQTPSDK